MLQFQLTVATQQVTDGIHYSGSVCLLTMGCRNRWCETIFEIADLFTLFQLTRH